MFMAFAALASSIVEFLFFIAIAVVVYQVFIAEWVDTRRNAIKQKQSQHDSIDKIAQVKLVSDDAKDIEKFITSNAEHISNEMVARLVDRIETIKTDQYINADSILKKRIDDLVQPEEEDEPVAKRARGAKR